MLQKIQVFSPHFDDASLSCGEHILRWKKAAIDVEIYTIFSQFESHFLSQDSVDFMQRSGSASAQTFQHERSKEDARSMKLLGIEKFHWLGFTDGGFRSENEHPVYSTHKVLFAGNVLDNESWQKKLGLQLQRVLRDDAVAVFPLGVGQHADHLLVSSLLQQLVPKQRQLHYVDVPYAFSFHHWTSAQFSQFTTQPRSLMWSSAQKLKAVEAYTSQVPTLFYDALWQYPECLIGQALS